MTGLGTILDSSGLVMTTNHVIDGASTISALVFATGQTYCAVVVGDNPNEDVALLQLQGASGLPSVSTNSVYPSVGDPVVALGAPSGGTPAVYSGKMVAIACGCGYIETSFGVQLRDSGGPLVDGSGQVIGMETARPGAQGTVSYAIPILDVTSEHGGGFYLGLPASLGVSTGSQSAPTGVPIVTIVTPSPAARVGMAVGDLLLSINGRQLDSKTPLWLVMRGYDPGERVTVRWLDASGHTRNASVTLGYGPAD
jgi:S1-C subfamily serine protease